MGNDWEDRPRWQQEGRTGPNGPRYASRRDRNAVRRGKPVGREVGSGRRKIPHNVPQGKTSHRAGGGGGGNKKNKCCFWVEAGKAVWAGKFRLASRFARRGVKHHLGIA